MPYSVLRMCITRGKSKLEKTMGLIRAITDEAANTNPAQFNLEIPLDSK